MVNCVAELCRWGGSYTLLRKLWGNFRATLGRDNPLYSLRWNCPETLVGNLLIDEFVFFSSFFSFSLSLMDVSCSACKSCVATD